METTRLSTKGQIVLPKELREANSWGPGTEFTIEKTADGILLRPAPSFPITKLDDVAGCLRYTGKPKTLKQMDDAVQKEVKLRHDRGRY